MRVQFASFRLPLEPDSIEQIEFLRRHKIVQTRQEFLESGRYVPGDYRYFTIYEPKERLISVAPFRDRVVHHALVRILEPVYERRFICDSCTT